MRWTNLIAALEAVCKLEEANNKDVVGMAMRVLLICRRGVIGDDGKSNMV